MNPTTDKPLNFTGEELALMAELLETEQAKLLVGIRHTFHREYRDELHRKLELVERLIERVVKPG